MDYGTNIESYLGWRGDIPFSVSPFSEIDAIVLCKLAYYDLVALDEAKTEAGLSLAECTEEASGLIAPKGLSSEGRGFFEKTAATKRFGDVHVCRYVDTEPSLERTQFSAEEFHLPDGRIFVAFRGTDSTILGWKEDFELSFKETEAQKRARSYLAETLRHAEESGTHLLVGGHSKGANLAQYATEPCQYNGQRNRRFLCCQHGFRIGLEGILEAAGELLHGLCRHAVPDGLVRTEAAAAWLDEPDRPVLRRGCIRRAPVAVPLVLQRPEERLRDRIVMAAAGAAHGEPRAVRCRPGAGPAPACWLPRPLRDMAPPAAWPRERAIPGAATTRPAPMLSRSLQPAAMRVHRSMATARQLEPPVVPRWAMPPTGSVAGTGPGKSLPMRPGRTGASLSGTAVLREALGQMPRIPSPDMHFRTRQGTVPAKRPCLGSPVSSGQTLRKPERLPLASHIPMMASLRGPHGSSPLPPAFSHRQDPGLPTPGTRAIIEMLQLAFSSSISRNLSSVRGSWRRRLLLFLGTRSRSRAP